MTQQKLNDIIETPEFKIVLFDQILEKSQNDLVKEISLSIHQNIILYIQSLDQDIKRLLLHFITINIFNKIQELNGSDKILFVQPTFKDHIMKEFVEARKTTKVYNFVFNTLLLLSKRVPFPMYVSRNVIDLNNMSAGETKELIHKLQGKINKFKNSNMSSKLLKKFTQKKGLIYLEKEYLQSKEFKKLFY